MSFTSWAALRTIGGLAGNQAYYKTKINQLGKAALPDHQSSPRIPSQADLRLLSPSVLQKFAEKEYGPSRPVWENKIRSGLLSAFDELQYLKKKTVFSDANCFRFLEIHTFFVCIQEDLEVMNDIRRLDFKSGEVLGLNKLNECLEVIMEIASSPIGNKKTKITECGPRMQQWWNNISTHSDMAYILSEALFRIQGQAEKYPRSYGELHLEPATLNNSSNETLIECSDCGGKVSKKAKSCPHCGNPEVNS